MCTHTSIDTALDYWQRVAETLNRLASQNGDDAMTTQTAEVEKYSLAEDD